MSFSACLAVIFLAIAKVIMLACMGLFNVIGIWVCYASAIADN
ncbi:hypothetical protein [Shewanella sairae]|nr:hypothetical protein [Shewanella sairae]